MVTTFCRGEAPRMVRRRNLIVLSIILLLALIACTMPAAQQAMNTPVPTPTSPRFEGTTPTGETPGEPTQTADAAPTVTITTPPHPNILSIAPDNVTGLQIGWSVELDDGQIAALAFSPDSRVMAVSGQSTVYLIDRATEGDVLARYDFGGPAQRLTFSPDGGVLGAASGSAANPIVRLWDIASGSALESWNERFEEANTLAFSPDQVMVATGYEDGTVKLWNSSTRQVTVELSGPEGVYDLGFSPEGDRLAVSGQFSEALLTIWDLDGNPVGAFSPLGLVAGPVASPLLSPDWKTLAWISRGTVVLIDSDSEEELHRFSHEDFVQGVAFSPDGRLLVTSAMQTIAGGFQPVVQIWDTQTGEAIHILVLDAMPTRLVFSPDGTLLAMAVDKMVVVWDVGL
jgi:WD40 repeat protein